jgi:hypothetical protein
MLHNKKLYGFLAGLAFLFIVGCYKDKTVTIDTGAEITRSVSFATDIIPLFNNSCNLSGCHSAGGKAPDLAGQNAYTSLTNGSYVDTKQPDKSELFLWMTGKRGTPMPVSGPNKDYNALILAWIKQGALNN